MENSFDEDATTEVKLVESSTKEKPSKAKKKVRLSGKQRTVRDLFDDKDDKRLNKIGYVNTDEYYNCDPKIKRIYDMFIRVTDDSETRNIKSRLDSNAGKLNKPVRAYKRHEYGHGNMHISECYGYAKMLLGKGVSLPYFEMAILLHDESLAYGYGRKTHHEDPMKYVMLVTDYKHDTRTNITITPYVDIEDINPKQYNMVGDLIRTHRMTPFKAYKHMSSKYSTNANIARYMAGVSCIDKITNISPLTVRNRSWDENYNLEIHFKKLKDRWLDKDSAILNKEIFNKIFGENDGEWLYNFFLKAVNDFDSEEFKLWQSHIDYTFDETRSGNVKLMPV